MTYFLGNYGRIRLRRDSQASFASSVLPADINTTINRIGIDGASENIITGDEIQIRTTDARGLDFLPTSTWPDGGGVTQQSVLAYANVNAVGGIRLFSTFDRAVNNNPALAYPVEAFTGAAIPVDVSIGNTVERLLGDVTGFTFNTDREALDTTTMSDRFKSMYSAGLISGSGTIDCLFTAETSGLRESSLLLLQLINRVELGSSFTCFLQLTESDIYPQVQDLYYEFTAVITKSGIEVRVDQAITCAIDFVTTGEIKLLIGQPSGYVLKEDNDKIQLQQNLDFLLTETED